MENDSGRPGRKTGRVVLVFIHHYLPGFEAGGALRSLANMVELLGDEFDFHIVTSNHDLLDRKPYPGVLFNRWVPVGKARVWYCSGGLSGAWSLFKELRKFNKAPVYLNSLFDPAFSLVPLVLAKLGVFKGPVIVGPRGELSPGALQLKSAKKRVFLKLAQTFQLYKDVVWHASTQLEKQDIVKIFPDRRASLQVHVACDLVTHSASDRGKEGGNRDVVFLSRISRKKNLDFALKALSLCQEPAVFHIYGTIEDAGYWDECKTLIAGLPSHVKVVFHGALAPAQVPDALASHGLFFFPTRGENYGHVIAEALAAGLPVLLSDRTPWYDVVDGGAGWVLTLDNVGGFAYAIDGFMRMSSEEHRRLSADVRAFAAKRICRPEDVDDSRRLFTEVTEGLQ